MALLGDIEGAEEQVSRQLHALTVISAANLGWVLTHERLSVHSELFDSPRVTLCDSLHAELDPNSYQPTIRG